MRQSKYKKHQVVFWEGDPGNSMYYVQWGSVGVYKDYARVRQKQLAVLKEGEYFGEMGLISNEVRSATIVVLENGTVLNEIGEDDFGEFLANNPARVHDILVQLSHKLREVTQDYLEVCQAVRDVVGSDEIEEDDSTDYHFADNEKLVAIHDKVQRL